MDFDIATRRLQQDQQSALARARASRNARTTSAKAKREAQAARAKAEKRLKEKKLESERTARVLDRVVGRVRMMERTLGVTNVALSTQSQLQLQSSVEMSQSSLPLGEMGAASGGHSSSSSLFTKNPLASGWTLSATSIYGDGDKIALPPSILETLTSGAMPDLDPWGGGRNGRPLAFRIGVLNPDYSGFPSSEKMRALVESVRQEVVALEESVANKALLNESSSSAVDESNNDQVAHDDMDASDDENDNNSHIEAYLDELSHRYLSYTHGTVVEFTQDDGCVGLPEPIANALMNPNSHSLVGPAITGRKTAMKAKRTVDPAFSSMTNESNDGSVADSKEMGQEAKDTEVNADAHNSPGDDDDGEKTPGHPAYGKFDIPSMPIEITPLNSIPPGKDCTLTPTASSIQNGFYGLKDVKLVLEQSLMRTRATLSKGDVIRTWRRGVSFDLIVSKVSPGGFGVVSCVNTDLNVDIGPPEGEGEETGQGNAAATSGNHYQNNRQLKDKATNSMGQGRLLSEPTTTSSSLMPLKETYASSVNDSVSSKAIKLCPEPPENETQGVCSIQIRGRDASGSSAVGRRRFNVSTATISDLFVFASHVCGEGLGDSLNFRLVTRFPRRVFRIRSAGMNDASGEEGCFGSNATLESVGVREGQELFMVEKI